MSAQPDPWNIGAEDYAGAGIGKASGRRSAEPIAIVGMACKFPGAGDLNAFWQLLMEGGNTVTEGLPGSGGERLVDLFGDSSARNEACRVRPVSHDGATQSWCRLP